MQETADSHYQHAEHSGEHALGSSRIDRGLRNAGSALSLSISISHGRPAQTQSIFGASQNIWIYYDSMQIVVIYNL